MSKGNPRATIETLALGWPKCFSVFKRRRGPLKVGIRWGLLPEWNQPMSDKSTRSKIGQPEQSNVGHPECRTQQVQNA